MQTLDKKELATFVRAQPDYRVYLKETWLDSKTRNWILVIEIPSTEQLFTVVTTQGKTRHFKMVETAIDFVKEACPNNQNKAVIVTYGDAPS